jgi:hypothetical protein
LNSANLGYTIGVWPTVAHRHPTGAGRPVGPNELSSPGSRRERSERSKRSERSERSEHNECSKHH